MSKVTSKAKKAKSKSKVKSKSKTKTTVFHSPIVRRSNEEVCLNYLIMRSRSKTMTSTLQDVFDLAPLRFKTIEKVQKSLDVLIDNSCVVFTNGQYFVTNFGISMRSTLTKRRKTNILLQD